MSSPLFEISGLHCTIDGCDILYDLSLAVCAQQRWAIIGPNGAGKSTLLRVMAGLVRAAKGTVLLDGVALNRYSARKRAVRLAYMPQKPEGVIPYTVRDFVMLGRYAAMGMFALPAPHDLECAQQALEICDVAHLAARLMNSLSGGELQRVLLAGAVAQDSALLLLDEPTTFLDPAHERLFFEALARLHTTRKLTTVMITHDINNALLQCSHILALRQGTVSFCGTSAEFSAQCPGILQELFGVPFNAFSDPVLGTSIYGAWEAACSC